MPSVLRPQRRERRKTSKKVWFWCRPVGTFRFGIAPKSLARCPDCGRRVGWKQYEFADPGEEGYLIPTHKAWKKEG